MPPSDKDREGGVASEETLNPGIVKVESVFNAKSRLAGGVNRAVVIHCSDHRFQEAFREFLSEGLGLDSYAPLVIPGGPYFCSLEQLQPKFAKAGFQSVSFLIKRTGARRIVILGHRECLFFKDYLQFFFPQPDLNRKQFGALGICAAALSDRFEGSGVEIYFADAGDDGSVNFLRIEQV